MNNFFKKFINKKLEANNEQFNINDVFSEGDILSFQPENDIEVYYLKIYGIFGTRLNVSFISENNIYNDLINEQTIIKANLSKRGYRYAMELIVELFDGEKATLQPISIKKLTSRRTYPRVYICEKAILVVKEKLNIEIKSQILNISRSGILLNLFDKKFEFEEGKELELELNLDRDLNLSFKGMIVRKRTDVNGELNLALKFTKIDSYNLDLIDKIIKEF